MQTQYLQHYTFKKNLEMLYSAGFSASVAVLFSSLAVCSFSAAGSLLPSEGPSMLSSFAPFSVASDSSCTITKFTRHPKARTEHLPLVFPHYCLPTPPSPRACCSRPQQQRRYFSNQPRRSWEFPPPRLPKRRLWTRRANRFPRRLRSVSGDGRDLEKGVT